jgi:TatD DNase family protein
MALIPAFGLVLPVIVHCRYSHERALKMVAEREVPQAVFHWYSGPLELIDAIVGKGFFVSATPALAYSRKHQEAIRAAPLENLLLETDSPVLGPTPDGRNEPANVTVAVNAIAAIKGIPNEEVLEAVSENALRLFGDLNRSGLKPL